VPQREKDIAKAKELMAAAGMADGFEVTLTTEKYLEIPDYAVIIQNAVKEIGVKINLNILDQGRLLRRRRATASRPGSIPIWASPTMAIAACRTSTSPHRSRATAPGTRPISRTSRV
jgi:ABC-type transport system substrate-binding protein